MSQAIINDAEVRMSKTYSLLKDQYVSLIFGGVGGAIENLKIEYYGSMTPLLQLAVITSPYRGKYAIRPHDPATVKNIERAIHKANLGVSISAEKGVVLVSSPTPTQEVRHKLAAHALQLANDAKIAVRKIRQDVRTRLKKTNLPEDDEKKLDRELQEVTDTYCKEIDEIRDIKQASILE